MMCDFILILLYSTYNVMTLYMSRVAFDKVPWKPEKKFFFP